MAYDALFGKTDRYTRQKTALDTELEFFSEEEKKAADAVSFMEASDSELLRAFLDIEQEFEAKKEQFEEQKEQLNQTREGLAEEISRELQKLDEVQKKLEHLSGKSYAKGTEKASFTCREYEDRLEEMLRALGADGSKRDSAASDQSRKPDTDTSPDPGDWLQALFPACKSSAFAAHEQKLGTRFVNHMQEILDQSKHEDVKKLYETYGSRLTIYKAHHMGGAYYQHGKGICINTLSVAAGGLVHKPYQAAFHEFGHNLDYLLGGGEPISEKWGDGALYQALLQDFAALKGERSDRELVQSLQAEIGKTHRSLKETLAVSDMIEYFTGISYPFGSGHGKKYWEKRLPCREFFAEVLDGAAANEDSYAFLKQIFPRGVKVVHQMIGGEAE